MHYFACSTLQVRHKAIAIAIEEELQLTPWSLTNNFYEFRHGRLPLAIAGIGDPTGRGDGFSYTRLRMSKASRGLGSSLPTREPSRVSAPGSFTTDGILIRKMTKKGAVEWLTAHGQDKSVCAKLSRTDCLAMVREVDGQLYENASAGATSSRMEPTQLELSNLAKEVWRRHIEMLHAKSNEDATVEPAFHDASGGGGGEDEDDDDDDDDAMEAAMAAAMEKEKSATVNADYDKRELEEMRRELREGPDVRTNATSADRDNLMSAPGGALLSCNQAASTLPGGSNDPLMETRVIEREVLRETRWEKEKGKNGGFRKVIEDSYDQKKIKEFKMKLKEEAQRQQRLQSDAEKRKARERVEVRTHC